MKFEAPTTAGVYAGRAVDDSWSAWSAEKIQPAGKDVVDIGCGGGIYSGGFLQSGAKSVIGLDLSLQYLREARDTFPDAHFVRSACEAIPLSADCADVIFQRALTHHLNQLQQRDNAAEMARILRHDGVAIIQTRTMEDVMSRLDVHWMRRELMDLFPRLLHYERSRRPDRESYRALLLQNGFATVEIETYAEVRRLYGSWDELEADMLARKGKSILFQLNERELKQYVRRLHRAAHGMPLVEQDQWTVWIAHKHA